MIQNIHSHIYANGTHTTKLKECFTAGLIAIRMYPHLKEKDALYESLKKELEMTRPSDGGGWMFFHPDEKEGDLIAPDADTTAVCWSACLLLKTAKPSDCLNAYTMIKKSLSLGGDLYFDGTGRVDIIALIHMLFFVLLFDELNTQSTELSIINKTIKVIEHVLECETVDEYKFWMRYYAFDHVHPKERMKRFLFPLFLRWPGMFNSLERLCDITTASISRGSDLGVGDVVFHTPTRTLEFRSSDFSIACQTCVSFPKLYESKYKFETVGSVCENDSFDILDACKLTQSVRMKELADHCFYLPDHRLEPFWTKDAKAFRDYYQSHVLSVDPSPSHLNYTKIRRILQS